ncbi:MAG: outer membrane beta-barrel protein [Bdellovibrionales bacterium]|nr:outer membrane beta-barrel protein [Ramlibacter sp.]
MAPAMAQDMHRDTGTYIGGNLGRTDTDFGNAAINQRLAASGFAVTSRTEDDRDTGYKLYGGYHISRNFAVEAGFFDLGKTSYTFNTAPPGSYSGRTRVRGLNLDLVGIAPVSDRFSVFGRIGAAYARSRVDNTTTGFVPGAGSTTRNSTNLKVGVGVEYAINEALAVRGELERYRINDPIRNRGHIDMASVGLVYHLGPKAQTRVAAMPVVSSPPPAPVARSAPPPPPPPAPVYVAPPPPAPAPAPAYEPPVRPAKLGRN